MANATPSDLRKRRPSAAAIAAGLFVFAMFALAFWHPIVDMVGVWVSSEDYQHGFFVPIFAAYLLWRRREKLNDLALEGGHWWAAPFFAVVAVLLAASAVFSSPVLGMAAILPAMAGMSLFLGGWRAVRWAWPSLVFLIFMIPLPGAWSTLLAQQLQKVAAMASTYILQTIGIHAYQQGNQIMLTEAQLDVERACSGLRMLILFFAICMGGAFMSRGPLWEKIVLVASAVPIAIITNVTRITATAIQREYFPNEWLNDKMHDMAGLAMPVLAIALLWLEYQLLQKLFPTTPEDQPIAFAGPARDGAR